MDMSEDEATIRWLVERTESGPAFEALEQPSVFLCSVEEEIYEGLKTEKRRRDWLLGRRTAKRLLQRLAADLTGDAPSLASIAITAGPDGSPALSWGTPDAPLPEVTISISHSHDTAFCAAVALPDFPLGADLELIEPRAAGFAAEYFTPAEMELVERASVDFHPVLVTAIWSAKEAAFKAVRSGLTIDTRSVSCLIQGETAPAEWSPFEIRWETNGSRLPALSGWWRVWGEFVLTLAAGEGDAPAR